MNATLLILGLILFVGLVVIHELGHFIAARRNGVEVEEFGIGFPPRVWKKKLKNKTLLTINLLPLGGFVKLKGEHDADTEEGSYGAASLWAKTKIILAGVIMNLLVAWLLFTLVALIGMPRLFPNQFTVESDTKVTQKAVFVAYVEPNSPAAEFLKPADQLIAIGKVDGPLVPLSDQDLPEITKNFPGEEVTVQYKRGNETLSATTRIRGTEEIENSKDSDNPKGYLGIVPNELLMRRSTWSAPVVATGIIGQFTAMTYQGIATAMGALFQGNGAEASGQVSGPVGVFVILRDGSLLGIQFILMIVAVISLTLAIMNILPIPALDGGRLFVTYLFRALNRIAKLFGKKIILTEKWEEWIHGLGFIALMGLFVLITVVDVRRFF